MSETADEVWIREDEEFPVSVRFGKKTNLLKLKKDIVSTLEQQVKRYNETRRALFDQPEMDDVGECMVCGSSSESANPVSTVYGAVYCQCSECSHVYLKRRPTQGAISRFYLSDANYAATYTNREAAEFRLNAIAVPWLEWALETYRNAFGRDPKKVVDVGSGAGHFVEACRRKGIAAEGIEISEASRKFSKDVWGFEQDGRDFVEVAEEYAGADLVTFWGLLEHTPNPGEILDAARRVVGPGGDGMVIAKLPRWNSMSSAVQTLCPDTVVRHLDPMGHIMAFSDASAAELYHAHRFAPTAAWYYGMDVYETLMQFCHQANHYGVLTETGELQMELQQKVDEARFPDGIVLAGKVVA